MLTEVPPNLQGAIADVAVEKPSESAMFVKNEFCNDYASVSPDGRWIAYDSTVSRRSEVYVERYPQLGGRQQISSSGGRLPRWSSNGRGLAPDGRFIVIRLGGGTDANTSAPNLVLVQSWTEELKRLVPTN